LTDKTTADGRFEFTPLPIGTYTVVVEAPSFKKATVESVRLSIQQQAAVNVVLQPGAVTENVEVTEAPELMQTQSSSVGQVLEEKTIEDLPLNGRDYTMLVMLTPGVTLPQQGPAPPINLWPTVLVWRKTIICWMASTITATVSTTSMAKPT